MPVSIRSSVSRSALAAIAVLLPGAASAAGFDPLAPERPAEPTRPQVVRPLPATPDDLVLRGEYDRLSLPVFLTKTEAAEARAVAVRISERAVSALPEGAALTVLVNGQPLTSLRGTDLAVGETLTLPLTPGMLAPGFNAITLVGENRHRVDCSAEATYELWSRLDPSATGIVFSSAPTLGASLEALPSILQRADGTGNFRLVLPAGTPADETAALIEAMQAVALAGWSWQPSVTVVDAPSAAPGTEIHLLPTAAGLEARRGVPLTDGLWAVPSSAEPDRLDLVFVAGSAGEIAAIAGRIASAARERPSGGTPEGLAALGESLLRPVGDDASLSLGALGFRSATTSGRRFADGVRVALPADFFASGYGSVNIALEGGYAPDLTRDSQLLVRVNGRVAVTVDLSSARGEVFEQREVRAPLSLFHPGVNAIDFEAVTRTADDLACDVAAQSGGAPRFALMDTTRITFPTLARVGSLPELGATVNYGFPYGSANGPVPFYLPGRDAASLGVGATLALRMAVNRGALVPVDVHLSQPPAEATGGIVIAPKSQLPGWLAAMAIPPTPAARPASGPAAPALTPAVPEPAPAATEPFNPFATPGSDGRGPTIAEWARHEFDRLVAGADWSLPEFGVGDHVRRIADRTFGRPDDHAALPLEAGDLLIAQNAVLPTGVSPLEAIGRLGVQPRTWTVVTALDEASLAGAMARLAEGDGWPTLQGARVISRGDGIRTETFAAIHPVMFATKEPSLTNARLTAAGWFSNKSAVYLALVLALSALLGLVGHLYARAAGVKE